MSMLLPDQPRDPSSPGAVLSARAPLEDSYRQLVNGEVEAFVTEVGRRATDAAGGGPALTVAVALVLWAAMIDRVSATVPATSQLLAELAASDLPERAVQAATGEVARSAQLGLSAAETDARIKTALGIAKAPVEGMGGEYGKMLLQLPPDGGAATSVRSWAGDSDAMARTASTADFGQSMIDQMRAEGYTHKRWATRYDSRVRATHAAVDRVTVLLDETFLVGGSVMRYPADPMVSDIGEAINCRCVLVAVRY